MAEIDEIIKTLTLTEESLARSVKIVRELIIPALGPADPPAVAVDAARNLFATLFPDESITAFDARFAIE